MTTQTDPQNEPTQSHDHSHDHSHSHGGHDDPFHPRLGEPLDTSGFDPANKSLAEALRLSFAILSVVMIALLVMFLASGVYKVNEGQLAVQLRFGELLGPADGAQVLEPGGPYWAWPQPIDQIVYIPTSVQQVALDDAFWVSLRPEDRLKTIDQLSPKSQLQPDKDGWLITGDKNIVHGRWTLSYQVDRDHVDDFVRSVSGSTDKIAMIEAANQRVKAAAERAIVHVVATVEAEDFIRGKNISSEIRGMTQKYLDELSSGITVVAVAASEITAPLYVRNDFDAVTKAMSERATKIEDARKEAEKTLSDAAGPAHPALALAIDRYELARREGDQATSQQTATIINQLLEGTAADKALAPLKASPLVDDERFVRAATDARVGGQVSELLSEARSYRNSAYEQVKAEADQFERLLPLYKENPVVYRELTRLRTLQDIYGGKKTEIIPIPGGVNFVLDINSDPRFTKALEEDKYRIDREQAQIAKERSMGLRPRQ